MHRKFGFPFHSRVSSYRDHLNLLLVVSVKT
jgi:hypothetical protein